MLSMGIPKNIVFTKLIASDSETLVVLSRAIKFSREFNQYSQGVKLVSGV